MSDLSELAALLNAKPRTGRVYTAEDTIPRSREVGPQIPEAGLPPTPKAQLFDPNATPGDEGFDWSKYGEWKAAQNALEAPTFTMAHDIKREQEKALRDEQEAKFASGEIDTTGKRPYVREILASATPAKLAALGALLAVPATGGASLPVAAALEGAAAGGGHILGDVAQREAQSMGSTNARPSSSLADELAQAGETAIATGATSGIVGGATNLLGKISKPLLMKAASFIPGPIGRAAKLAQLVGVGAEETGAAAGARGAATAAEPPSGFANMPRKTTISRPEAPYRGTPDIENYRPLGETVVERGGSTYAPPTSRPAPSVRYSSAPDDAVAGYSYAPPGTANAENIARRSSYGSGGVFPEPVPTEYRDPVLEGLREQVAPRVSKSVIEPDLPDFEYVGGEAEPVAGYSTLTPPSATLPPPARTQGLPESWKQFAAPARKFPSPKRPSRARAVAKD